MEDVVAVSVGQDHTMAIKADGSLWAWGWNGQGQLGDGTTENRYTPVRIMEDVAMVSAGRDHTAAIKTDGSLWVWGLNDRGQLGDGTTTRRLEPVHIMDDVAAVAASGITGAFAHHTLAVKTDGSLWAWGANTNGQLGDGTTEDRHSPVHIMDNVMLPGGAVAVPAAPPPASVDAGGWLVRILVWAVGLLV